MTKEQITKHSETIKWWCDNPDKDIWFKDTYYTNGEWCKTDEPKWFIDTLYVPDDIYSELRRAKADSGTIQWRIKNEDNWTDYRETDLIPWTNDLSCYRIKPKEPKFKIGDYCVDKSSGMIIRVYEDMLYGNFRLWTLKEASDDEYVIVQLIVGTLPYPTIIKVKDIRNNKDIKWVVPYIGQPPEELNL